MVSDSLSTRGYRVWLAQSASEAEAAVDQLQFDLIVLDLILPDRNGLLMCAQLKARARAPLIICSGTQRKDDAVIGLQLGADDFIPKPFSVDELQARIDLVLRRAPARGEPGEQQGTEVQRLGNLTIDRIRCWVAVEDRPLHLTPTEYRLLSALIGRATEVLSRQELAGPIWGPVDASVNRSLDVHLRRLRMKLCVEGATPKVVARRGFGYQLVDRRS
jgi:DNA-binding response OmpR family regulator